MRQREGGEDFIVSLWCSWSPEVRETSKETVAYPHQVWLFRAGNANGARKSMLFIINLLFVQA